MRQIIFVVLFLFVVFPSFGQQTFEDFVDLTNERYNSFVDEHNNRFEQFTKEQKTPFLKRCFCLTLGHIYYRIII